MQELISNFGSYKIDSTIAFGMTANGTGYTVPADCFAIFQVYMDGGTANVIVSNIKVFSAQLGAQGSSSTAPGELSGTAFMNVASWEGFYAGPGATIGLSGVVGTNNRYFTGVLFRNSP